MNSGSAPHTTMSSTTMPTRSNPIVSCLSMAHAMATLVPTPSVLASSTDGVGTKVAIAWAMDKHDTIGFDLVGMVVDDIVVCGAEPLFMTDYIATGKVVPERIASIVSGIAAGCVEAGVALVGGETAEHPGLLKPDEYDCAGAATGVVEFADILGPQRVVAGDVVVALASSGLHSNGYSLVRKVFASAGWARGRQVPEFGRTLGEELLEPTRVYARDLLALIRTTGIDIHALSHVTGGGLAANLARVLPQDAFAQVDRSTWTPPAVFEVVREVGHVPLADLERTLSMGIGFVAVLPAAHSDLAIEILKVQGISAWLLGQVSELAKKPGTDPLDLQDLDSQVAVGCRKNSHKADAHVQRPLQIRQRHMTDLAHDLEYRRRS